MNPGTAGPAGAGANPPRTELIDPIVGIDLGTTNSVVAVAVEPGVLRVLEDEEGRRVQPSVVSFDPSGAVFVGTQAKERRAADVGNTVFSIKRLIGRRMDSPEVREMLARLPFSIQSDPQGQPVVQTRSGLFSVTELSAIVLDHMRDIAERRLATEVTRAVITVPANFTDAQRAATESAGTIAGLDVAHVINEPTAAALAYGQKHELEELIAVYDLGGGTFDVSIVKLSRDVYEVLGTAGHAFLGGEDIDERVALSMVDLFARREGVDLRPDREAMQRLRGVAETIKIELSRRKRAMVTIDELAYRGGKPLSLRFEMTREELEAHAREVIEQTFPVCQEAARMAGLAPDRIKDVLLVGGSTRMPYVRERVAAFFHQPPRVEIDPDVAVAMGAALQGMSLRRVLGISTRRRRKHVLERYAPTVDGEPSGVHKRVRAPTFDPRFEADDSEPTYVPTVDLEAPLEGEDALELPDVRGTTDLGLPLGAGRSATTAPTYAGKPAGAQRGRWDSLFDGVESMPESDTGAHSLDYSFVEDSSITSSTARVTGSRQSMSGRIDLSELADDGIELDLAAFLDDAESDLLAGPEYDGLGSGLDAEPPADSYSEFEPELPAPYAPAPSAPAPSAPAPSAPAPRARQVVTAPPSVLGATSGTPLSVAFDSDPVAGPAAPAQEPAPAPGRATPDIPAIIDVMPRGLGVGTVSGYCDLLLPRNQRVPTEVTRVFTTSKDDQDTVSITICQGESRRIADNIVLGDLVLDGIEPRPRGESQIEVLFQIDASGILRVRARDMATGKETRTQLDITGRTSDEQVQQSADRLRHILH